MNIAGVVLAAGGSRRLGEPKQLLRDQHDETLVHKVAREAGESGLQPVVVVVGAYADDVRAAVADLDVIIEENVRWSEGISTSIRAGIAAAREAYEPLPCDYADPAFGPCYDEGGRDLNFRTTRIRSGGFEGALLMTCDMPSVGKPHLAKLIEAFGSRRRNVASHYGDAVGIPAIISAIDVDSLNSMAGDSGAKALFRNVNTVLVPLEGGTFDLDTAEDVARWREKTNE